MSRHRAAPVPVIPGSDPDATVRIQPPQAPDNHSLIQGVIEKWDAGLAAILVALACCLLVDAAVVTVYVWSWR